MSFSASPFLDFPPPGWSLRWYQRFFSQPDWYGALLLSLELALVTTMIAIPIGLAAAYAFDTGIWPGLRRLRVVFMAPLMVPHLILAVALFSIYAKLGWLGSFFGLLGAHVSVTLPFAIVSATSGLRACDMVQELAARSMGCGRLRAFLTVTLPQIRLSVLSGMLFVFVTSLDEVIISLFISSGSNSTVTKVMFESLRDEIDPTVAAVSTLLIGGSLAAAGSAMLLRGRSNVRSP